MHVGKIDSKISYRNLCGLPEYVLVFQGVNAGTNSIQIVINSRVARGRLEKATKELITVFRKKGMTKKNKIY